MSADEHLQPGQFYHGSNQEHSVGEVLTPEGANAAGRAYAWHSDEKYLYYTDHLGLARTYGSNVYQVEPTAPASGRGRDRKRQHDPEPGYPREYEYLSTRGVRVVGKVPDEDAQQAMANRTAARWKSRGGQETIRRILARGEELPESAKPHYRSGPGRRELEPGQ